MFIETVKVGIKIYTANNENVLSSISQEYACGAVGHIEIHVRLKWYDWYVRILLIFKHQPGTECSHKTFW